MYISNCVRLLGFYKRNGVHLNGYNYRCEFSNGGVLNAWAIRQSGKVELCKTRFENVCNREFGITICCLEG